MSWPQKDANYYNRLALISRMKRFVESRFEFEAPFVFPKPIPYSYAGGRKLMISIERHKYVSCFKREFKTIRILLDDGTYVRLVKLRMKHLTKIYQILPR
jgi:hypothetical protein